MGCHNIGSEVVQASKLWFGAEPSYPPASFDLVCDTGELYLKSLVRDDKPAIDVLIVDAEDGSAPPASMRTLDFWTNTVLPTLNANPVIGVNVIGSEFDVANLVQTLEMVFSKHSKVLVVSPPSKANVSDRHDDLTHHNLFLARDALRGCVDLPHAWEEQVQRAIRERFVVVDGKLTT
uniref:PABS domain-containing protein n=1 Tax=Ditylum brightwellii TaxID=49249 RepID=A0A6U3TE70_9STRA|mmetsp:Transcript_37564/g.56201  ORF Transcript_37564/g.56201 Transcript_37564/m.56201 type:complete len:178 (+) Transcript_37564:321-854(+)